jgi:hypothetical protein
VAGAYRTAAAAGGEAEKREKGCGAGSVARHGMGGWVGGEREAGPVHSLGLRARPPVARWALNELR